MHPFRSADFGALPEIRQAVGSVRLLLKRRYPRRPKALVRAFGCQQSVHDGERYEGLLSSLGYSLTKDVGEADLILFNTCAVRESAENRMLGNLGALKGLKEKKPGLILAVAGCMAEEPETVGTLKRRYPYVDLVLGANAFGDFPSCLLRVLVTGKRAVRPDRTDDGLLWEGVPVRRSDPFHAFVPVMSGCDNFCSYCVVPLVRGRERSRSPERVLDEIRGLVADGVKEITLIGQNVNSYGAGSDPPVGFPALLRRADAIPGDFRIRFMTSHPKDCTRELIDAVADSRKVEHHLHLPVQSGSDRILSLMNRRYDRKSYEALISRARARIPDLAVTSDVIVGFPGETREDFEETADLLRTVRFHALFTFIYSPRRGTAAERMDDPVPAGEKSARFRELLDLQQSVGLEIYRSYIGRTLRVLPERTDGKTGRLLCRSDEGILVITEGGPGDMGRFLEVRIENARNWALEGRRRPEVPR